MHTLRLEEDKNKSVESILVPVAQPRPSPLKPFSTEDERNAHKEFVEKMGEDMVWNKYWRRA